MCEDRQTTEMLLEVGNDKNAAVELQSLDGIDAESLLRTTSRLAPRRAARVLEVPIPDEAVEDARRCVRERTEVFSSASV